VGVHSGECLFVCMYVHVVWGWLLSDDLSERVLDPFKSILPLSLVLDITFYNYFLSLCR